MKVTVDRHVYPTTDFADLPSRLDADTVRVAVYDSSALNLFVETVECDDPGVNVTEFRQRQTRRDRDFVAVLCIPTGIGCQIGGHAGDAGAVAQLMGEAVDTLVLHPNVVNGCDINEMPENSLYVEGEALTRFMMGTIGLARRRKNKIGLYLEWHPDNEISYWTMNSANAARKCYGADIEVFHGTEIGMSTTIGEDGLPLIDIRDVSDVSKVIEDNPHVDAWAIASRVDIEEDLITDYFAGRVEVNPWGLVEAGLTHVLGNKHSKPMAHAPMVNHREELNIETGIVDARFAAETVSTTYVNCVFKGLTRAPALVSPTSPIYPDVIVEDVDALVIPRGVLGLQVWAAMRQSVPIIEVMDNENLMKNNLRDVLRYDEHYVVQNYHEAAGVLSAMKAGIDPKTTGNL